jgi:hypothetical protein
MPWSIADTQYDNTHPWDSFYNGVPMSRVLQQDPRQQQLMNQAVATANPALPAEVIRESMTAGPPADAGPARPQPTIDTILDGSALQPGHLYDRAPTDFSGTPAGIEASSRPGISVT